MKKETFYITKEDFNRLETMEGWNVYITKNHGGRFCKPVIISWEDPEPEVIITPSKLMNFFERAHEGEDWGDLEKELFGDME